MYICWEKFNLDSQQLSKLEKLSTESDTQERFEEEEALKAVKEDFDPISDDKESSHKVTKNHDIADGTQFSRIL
jgi:hypothetical protein